MKWLLVCIACFTTVFGKEDVPKLNLSASAIISKPADEIQMKIGVITLGLTAEEALTENSAKMGDIIGNLEELGLEKDDYETCQFSIRPTYTPIPKDPPPYWRQEINGYEVTNSIQIHSGKLDMAGEMIDVANQAGANSISDIRFGLSKNRDYWDEAIFAAGQNAVRNAETMARATGVELVRILSISLSHTQIKAPQLNLTCFAKAAGPAAPPIEAGEVSLEANVSLVYEIR